MDTELTIDEVRRELRARGLSVADWARLQGFSQSQVYAVLNGRTKGLRGNAYKVARALNLTPAPNNSDRFQCLDMPESQATGKDKNEEVTK